MTGLIYGSRFLSILTLLCIERNYLEATVVNLMAQGLSHVPDQMSQTLQELYLDDNIIRGINSTSFQTCPLLEVLSLENNDLKVIGENTFWNNPLLEVLLLGRNHLYGLPVVLGPSVPIMVTLVLLNAFSPDAIVFPSPGPYFRNFTSLSRLIVGSNALEPFDESSLPPTIKQLNMAKCGLTVFPNLSHFTPQLTNLEMGYNSFSAIPQQNIQLLLRLQEFDLEGNELSVMPNVSGLSSLRQLVLRCNDLVVIPDNTLDGLNNLELLVISENQLICIMDMSHLTALINLSMDENNLRSIPDLFALQLGSFNLGYNPLICNQSLCWIRMMPLMNRSLAVDDIICNYPSGQHGVFLMEVHPSDIECFNGECIHCATCKWLYIYYQCVYVIPTWHSRSGLRDDALWGGQPKWTFIKVSCPDYANIVVGPIISNINAGSYCPNPSATTPPWASYQICKIAGAHSPGVPGTFSPPPRVSDPDMYHGTCVTQVPWCIPGSLTSNLLWSQWRGKTFPAFPVHAQPAILRIWQEVHWSKGLQTCDMAAVVKRLDFCLRSLEPETLWSRINFRNIVLFVEADILTFANILKSQAASVVVSHIYHD